MSLIDAQQRVPVTANDRVRTTCVQHDQRRNTDDKEYDHLVFDHCDYCGSLNGDTFMRLIREDKVTLEPTDKNYKVYVQAKDDEKLFDFHHSGVRNDRGVMEFVLEKRSHTKFYFLHLSVAQQRQFVDLMNAGKVKFEYPGYFYRAPFFIQQGAATAAAASSTA